MVFCGAGVSAQNAVPIDASKITSASSFIFIGTAFDDYSRKTSLRVSAGRNHSFFWPNWSKRKFPISPSSPQRVFDRTGIEQRSEVRGRIFGSSAETPTPGRRDDR